MGIQVTPFQREKTQISPGNVHLPLCVRARGVDLRQPGGRLVHPLVLGGQLLVLQHDQPQDRPVWRRSHCQVSCTEHTQTIEKYYNSAFFSGLAAVFDGLVWHGVKGLKIY